jgi:hypothetical protein
MLFEHVQDPLRELCRIERDGTRVTVHHHRPDEDGRLEVHDHESFPAARAEYDRQIVQVYERGYRLVRDWVDPPLAHDATLEAMIAEDPYDDERWMVLADWVLTRDDARANIVRFEQSRRSRDPSEAWGQYPVQLFGGTRAAELLTEPLSRGEWQAGHVRACGLVVTGAVLEAFLAAPATRLVRDLALEVDDGAALAEALDALALAPCRPVLRRLAIQCTGSLEVAALAPILALHTAPALTTLGLRLHHEQAIASALDRVVDSPLRPQLKALDLGPIPAQVAALGGRYGAAFAHLQHLTLRTGDREALREPRA